MSNCENKVFTIPNILSFFRLLLIPAILLLYFYFHEFLIAAILVLVSAITDIADGFIARKFNMVSNIGKLLDPIADKLTQIAVLTCLCFEIPQMLIPVCILIVKEFITAIIGLIVVKKIKHNISAEWHGKVSTMLLYFTMMLHLFWRQTPPILSYVLIGLCVVMMIISFIFYILRFHQILQDFKNKETEKEDENEIEEIKSA